jgi:hypothetical protein
MSIHTYFASGRNGVSTPSFQSKAASSSLQTIIIFISSDISSEILFVVWSRQSPASLRFLFDFRNGDNNTIPIFLMGEVKVSPKLDMDSWKELELIASAKFSCSSFLVRFDPFGMWFDPFGLILVGWMYFAVVKTYLRSIMLRDRCWARYEN